MTGDHADAVVRQLQLELTYINDPNISPDAARASVDNILDIIDIIQGDAKLADMATQGGISGFSPFPDAANPAPTHLDNDVQTVFAANFIAQSNSLGQQAIDLVGSGDTKAIATLIDDLKAFEKFVTDFDAAQGGNALLDATGALGAEVAAMIKGLQTGDATLVTAAADQMHGNAADVGGNNVPVTGGTYNTDGVTVAEVLGTAPVAETPAADRRSSGAGPGTRRGPHHQRRAGNACDSRRHRRGRGPRPFGHARIGASFTSHVGIAARGAASSCPRCSGDAGGRYIESRTRSPIRLTRRTHRRAFHRPAPAKNDL